MAIVMRQSAWRVTCRFSGVNLASRVLFLCACLSIPSLAHAKTLEELLVEKGVITKAEAKVIEPTTASKVYWNRGTRVEFPESGFTTSLTTQIQSRYEFIDREGEEDPKNTSGFTVNRARLTLAGTALNREFAYKLQTDFVGTEDDKESGDSPAVRDAYLQWQPCEDGNGIRMGQFKTAVSRQFNVDQAMLQFADRSEVSEFFSLGRANGAMAFGQMGDGFVSGSLGIFNGQSEGEGLNRPPTDVRHTGVASARISPFGKMNSQDESDVEWTELPALSLGTTYAYSQGRNELSGVSDSFDSQIVNVDAAFKFAGYSASAEVFYQHYHWQDGPLVEPLGFYTQTGYFLVPRKVEIAGRYGQVDCGGGDAGPGVCAGVDKLHEVSATVNYYFWRHSLKAQFGYDHQRRDLSGSDSQDDGVANRWIFQISGYF